MKPYFLAWITWTIAGLLFAALVNLAVDPYGVHRFVDLPGVNGTKPHAGTHGAMVKAYGLERTKPAGLILGNSRAEVGFDPDHPAWPAVARPVYNAALPGTGVYVSLRYLQHALAAGSPKEIVVGLDFMDFLVAPDASLGRSSRPAEYERRLLVDADGQPNHGRHWQRVVDLGMTVTSLAALVASVNTLRLANDALAANLTASGFNPMRDYERIAAREGYHALFEQRDRENLRAYQARPNNLFVAGRHTSAPLEDLRRILDLGLSAGANMHLVIYPYHANLLKIFQETGLWPTFEAWKEELVRIAEAARRDGRATVRLWDFSGHHPLTAELVPSPKDRRTTMRYYWEAGHFKKELGDIVLERLLSDRGSVDPHSESFGVDLSRHNVREHLVEIRDRAASYRPHRLVGEVRDLPAIGRR